jgi:hypothetical protein
MATSNRTSTTHSEAGGGEARDCVELRAVNHSTSAFLPVSTILVIF